MPTVRVSRWWPKVSEESRAWLAANIGAPLPPPVAQDIFRQTGFLLGIPTSETDVVDSAPVELSEAEWEEIRTSR